MESNVLVFLIFKICILSSNFILVYRFCCTSTVVFVSGYFLID